MKNFFDQDSFDEVKRRLSVYSEKPDDFVWDNISASLHPNRGIRWLPWCDATTGILVLLMLSFLGGMHLGSAGEKTGLHAKQTDSNPADTLVFLSQTEKNHMLKPIREKQVTNSHTVASDHNLTASSATTGNSDSSHFIVNDVDHGAGMSKSIEGSGDRILESSAQDSVMLKGSENNTIMKAGHYMVSDSEKESSDKRRLSFYFQFTPMVSFQKITPETNDGVVVKEVLHRSLFSSERLAYKMEVGVQGWLTRSLQYYAGISLYRQRQTLHYRFSKDNAVVETTDRNEYWAIPAEGFETVHYNMTNIGANAGVMYSLYGRNLMHKLGTGLSYQQGLGSARSENYKNDASNYLHWQIFYRNEFQINAQLSLYIQPTFDYAFHVNEKLDAPFSVKPYSAGLGFGMIYKF